MSRRSIKQLKNTQLRPTSDDKEAGLFYSELEVGKRARRVGRVTYASGEEQGFTDPQKYLDIIQEELPYRDNTGFHHETLTDDPSVQKAVDDILLDFSGEGNPRRECSYGLTDAGKQALQNAADPSLPHTYAWFVMTDCNTPQEMIHRDLTLEEAVQLYQNSDRPEKRIGVTKDGIATVDIVHMADGEQQFFEDYLRLDSFINDPVVAKAAALLQHQLQQSGVGQDLMIGGI